MRTDEGYKVVYIQKAYHAKSGTYRGYTARIRLDDSNPYFDESCDFNSDGSAFRHEYGDINLSEVK